MANDASRSATAPRWRDALPPAVGLAAALAFALAAVLADSLLASGDFEPGALLSWLPLATAAVTFLLAWRVRGPVREGALAASLATLALSAAFDPSPTAWTYAASVLAAALTLVLRLEPATRLVASLPVLAGLLMAVAQLPPGLPVLALAIAAVASYLAALCFLVPHASGWRPVPFTAALVASLLVPVAVGGMLLVSLATDGVSRPDGGAAAAPGPSPLALAVAALALAAPVTVVALWRSRRAQEFQLPSLALPRPSRVPMAETSEAAENA